METITCDEMKQIYYELKFDPPPRGPSLYIYFLSNLHPDGRIAFTDAPQGPLIAKMNRYDGRRSRDGLVDSQYAAGPCPTGGYIGAGTMNAGERLHRPRVLPGTGNARIAAGMEPVPWNIISSPGRHGHSL